MMKGEAKSVYEALCRDLIRLNANWQVYTQLFTASEDRFVVFNNTAPGFFRLLQDLLVDNAVLSLSRLTDPAHFQSLPRLVKLLESQVSHTFHRQLSLDLDHLRCACDDIRKHRDKRVAHRESTPEQPQLVRGPSKLPLLTRKKINSAMAEVAALLNEVLGFFESTEQIFEPHIRGDADSLFYFLNRGHQAAVAERDAALLALQRKSA